MAVNKADGDNVIKARRARQELETAAHFMQQVSPHWKPPVLCVSALEGTGLDELWERVREHRSVLDAHGELASKRQRQRLRWMWSMVEEQLIAALRGHEQVGAVLPALERDVLDGRVTPTLAARRLLESFGVESG